jgi:hypothetical protein
MEVRKRGDSPLCPFPDGDSLSAADTTSLARHVKRKGVRFLTTPETLIEFRSKVRAAGGNDPYVMCRSCEYLSARLNLRLAKSALALHPK